ncbi:hypothetical protein C2E21_0086 [Chlorella sorokiniana]|uniref:Uncharacterized protein n=1 Tax=Chlorella sorokiniana TaxID=3076 RepID=A0A2P6U3L7_CHLSO|nr:hypothetical protein C2E21_0086 [Chlorella sorokiniana]|eukprot:PRW60905.1 hypothetical protein C2E21_0086 [Chlorella sorokiniana]
MAGSPRAAPHDTINKPLQHTRRHPVTAAAAERAAAAFGNNSEAAAAAVCLLRQPKLRQVFEHVFECTTASGNNQWMRGKLLQALGFSSRWQPAPKQQDEQLQPQTAGIPALVDSSEDSAQTLGRAGTWPPTPRSKRAAPVPGNSPSPKRRAASQAGSPSRAAAAAAPAAAAPASAAPGSVASDAVAGSSSEGQQQQRTLTPTWQQAAAPFDTMAAGSLTAQDTLLWQAPSLQQLLSLQHSTGSSGSADAAMQAALRVLGWGGLAGTAGLAVAPSFDPAAYQLLALDGTDLAFVWQAQLEAQQHPAWRDQMAAYPPPPLSFWAQQVAGGAAPDQAQQLAHTTQQQAQLAQQQQAQLQQAQLAQQQQAQQRFAVGLPTAAAVDQLPPWCHSRRPQPQLGCPKMLVRL